MAAHAPITGAPTRAPAFPDIDPLEDVGAVLAAVDGSLHLLTTELEAIEVQSHVLNATYTCIYALAHGRDLLRKSVVELTLYGAAQEGR